MRTTSDIKGELLEEAESLSGEKANKGAVEKALEEYIKRRKPRKLLGLEGKIEPSFNPEGFLERRRKDVHG